MYETLRFLANVPRYDSLVWQLEFGHILADISGFSACISKPIPCVPSKVIFHIRPSYKKDCHPYKIVFLVES